jgi:transposase
MLVEASWVAIKRDEGLGLAYSHFKERMETQKAIIRIARKMSNIIFSTLKTGNEYVPYA